MKLRPETVDRGTEDCSCCRYDDGASHSYCDVCAVMDNGEEIEWAPSYAFLLGYVRGQLVALLDSRKVGEIPESDWERAEECLRDTES